MKAVIKESRADNIIQHAQTVFFQKGYSKTAISDICQVANCSRTTLYSYFESKENLYLAVVKKAFQKFLTYFAQLDLEGKTGLERVTAFAMGYLDYAKTAPQHYQVMLDFYGILRSTNEANTLTEAHQKIAACVYFDKVNELAQLPLQLLMDEIRNGQQDGTIRADATPLEHMMHIWAYLKGISDISPIIKNIHSKENKQLDWQKGAIQVIRTMLV